MKTVTTRIMTPFLSFALHAKVLILLSEDKHGLFLYRPSSCQVPANEALWLSCLTQICARLHITGGSEVPGKRLSSQECNVPSDLLIHSLDKDDQKFLKYRSVDICTKYQFLSSKIVWMLEKDCFYFQNKIGLLSF